MLRQKRKNKTACGKMRRMTPWLGLKKPLFLAFFLGCTVSFLTARTLTLRLILPATIYWTFVPFIEIASLAVVYWSSHRKISFSTAVDSFFGGYVPWLVWLLGLCVIWSLFLPPAKAFDRTLAVLWLDGGAALAIVWSAYIDFAFFRFVLGREPGSAMKNLALQRLISWGLILAIVGGPTIWSDITGRLW